MSAVPGTCAKTDCTAAVTGRCLESHASPAECPHFSPRPADEQPVPTDAGDGSPPHASNPGRRFHPGLELGLKEVLSVTCARYSRLVGILGPANAGKTCFLTSLYLQATHGLLLPEFRFAGSETIQGFELRARKLRTWSGGQLPEQLADHTVLSDPRSPAFLHMSLDRPRHPGGRVELLLSDLPGEWSTQLIHRSAAAKRFHFLGRADALIIVVEGPRLARDETRHAELMGVEMLLQRLAESVSVDVQVPLILVASKCDEVDVALPPSLAGVEACARRLGFRPTTVPTASFSRDPGRVPNGQGVIEVLRAVVGEAPKLPCGPGPAPCPGRPARSFWRNRDR